MPNSAGEASMGGLQGTCADINNMHGVLQSLSFAVSSRLLCVSHGSSAPADGKHEWTRIDRRGGDYGMNSTGHSHFHFWLRELPYGVVWVLTIFGIAYTSFARRALIDYWEFLAVMIGILCI